MSDGRIRVRNRCTSARGSAAAKVNKTASSFSADHSHQPANMRLIVQTITETRFVVHVQMNANVGHVKLQIRRFICKRSICVKLFCSGRLLAPDAYSLTHFGILDGACLHVVWDMRPYFPVFVFNCLDSVFYLLLVHPDETVRDLKANIQLKQCLYVRCQQILLEGQILDDNIRLCWYNNLFGGSVPVLQLYTRRFSMA